MRRIGPLLGALVILAVLAAAAWWLIGRSAWRPPVPIKPALPDIPALQVGPIGGSGKSATQQPLLWSSRVPVEASSANEEQPQESEMSQLRLMAVLESAGRRVALLQRPDRTVLKIDTAQPEGKWRLDSFDGLVAVFVSETGQRAERQLEKVASVAGRNPPVGAPAPTGSPRRAPAPGARSDGGPTGQASSARPPPGALPPPPAGAANLPQRSPSPASPPGPVASDGV